MKAAERVQNILASTNARWKINGEHVIPNQDQIENTIDSMVETLINNPEASQIEVGGVIVARLEGHFDIYVRVGEYND